LEKTEKEGRERLEFPRAPDIYCWIIYTLMMGPTNRPETLVNNTKSDAEQKPGKSTQFYHTGSLKSY
jgi:hypothetical protein